MKSSIAIDCIYNDCKSEIQHIGFSGTCTRDRLMANVEQRKLTCGSEECACSEFYKNDLKGELPRHPCDESRLFIDWQIGMGTYLGGKRAGQPQIPKKTAVGEIAFLTTIFPQKNINYKYDGTINCKYDETYESETYPEERRKIIGFFEIDEIKGNRLYANKRTKVKLTIEESLLLDFWTYHRNDNDNRVYGDKLGSFYDFGYEPDYYLAHCEWSKFCRYTYLKDERVHRILTDMTLIIKDTNTVNYIHNLIEKRYGQKLAPLANGVYSTVDAFRTPTRFDISYELAQKKKYGNRGERNDHNYLKNYIGNNLSLINLDEIVSWLLFNSSRNEHKRLSIYQEIIPEYLFLNGDCADILIKIEAGIQINGDDIKKCIVIVEVEIIDPMLGAYQIVKYRHLLAKEGDIFNDSEEINPPPIKAVLVAFDFTDEVIKFCELNDVLCCKIDKPTQMDNIKPYYSYYFDCNYGADTKIDMLLPLIPHSTSS